MTEYVGAYELDIWTVDQPTVREVIRLRNALRRSALLPLLDEQKEFEHACEMIRRDRFRAFWNAHNADFHHIFRELKAARGPSRSLSHARCIYDEARRRFSAELHDKLSKEIDAMRRIAPDYLAITRETIEGND